MVIGSRQHALLILGHDASHYRYLPTRWQNDLFANLLLMWPTFASVEGFRKFHGTHHQFTNLPGDGNRHIWYTHDAMGELEPGWVFPKTRLGLALVLLRRAFFFTGMFWIVRGLVGSFLIPSPHWMLVAKLAFYLGVAGALTVFDAWEGSCCTGWFRSARGTSSCSMSASSASTVPSRATRKNIRSPAARSRLGSSSIFILPRNVGYHLEHHWYPSVPFYRLPELHQQLMAREGFRTHAVVRRSVLTSLGECVRP